MQAKLTSAYRNVSKAEDNRSEDCLLVEKAHSAHNFPKSTRVPVHIKVEDEERGSEKNVGAKRLHMEITSPRSENVRSPSCKEETEDDTSGTGFVTARTKLVSALLYLHLPTNNTSKLSYIE